MAIPPFMIQLVFASLLRRLEISRPASTTTFTSCGRLCLFTREVGPAMLTAAITSPIRLRIGAAMDVIAAVTPGGGAYANEADYFQPNWQEAFWGGKYERLLRVKRKYDPDHVFTVHHGVGSEFAP